MRRNARSATILRASVLTLAGVALATCLGCGNPAPPPRAPKAPPAPSTSSVRPEWAAVPRPPAGNAPRPATDERIRLAKAMMRENRFDAAEAALRSALTERRADGQVAFLLGVAIQKQKRYGDAKPYFEQALASKQSFPEVDYVFHFLGWCAYYLGDLALARDAFQEHLRRVPSEADSVFGLGVVALDDDRLEDAEAAFTKAIAMQEKDPKAAREVSKAKTRLGDVLVRREKLADAERLLREAVTLYPDHYEAWAKLARVLDRLERPDDAVKAREEEKAALARAGRV